MKLNNFDTDDLARFFLTERKKAIEQRNDEDYVVNQEQAEVFTKVVEYFEGLADPKFGEWVKATIKSPKEKHGDVLVHLCGLDFFGPENVKEFTNMLSHATALSISPLVTGEFEISFVIPNVFIEKTKKGGGVRTTKHEDFNNIKQQITSVIENIIADHSDGNYIANEKQVSLFVGIHEFLLNLTDDDEEFGEWVMANIDNPQAGSGSIIAQMVFTHFAPDKMTEFYLMLSAANATFSIFAMDEGFFKIIVDVPNIIVPKG